MSKIENILARIREAITNGEITKSELARRAGMRQTTLIRCDDPDWDPLCSTAKRLEPHVPPKPRKGARRPFGNGVRHGANQRNVAA